MIETNPYQPPINVAEPRAKTERALRLDPYFVVARVCGICMAVYGTLGTILNGLDLLRTLSKRDAITEAWLIFLMATGFVICTLAYRISKNRPAINHFHFSSVAIAATILLSYMEFG